MKIIFSISSYTIWQQWLSKLFLSTTSFFLVITYVKLSLIVFNEQIHNINELSLSITVINKTQFSQEHIHTIDGLPHNWKHPHHLPQVVHQHGPWCCRFFRVSWLNLNDWFYYYLNKSNKSNVYEFHFFNHQGFNFYCN